MEYYYDVPLSTSYPMTPYNFQNGCQGFLLVDTLFYIFSKST